jgi:hypothetical protein
MIRELPRLEEFNDEHARHNLSMGYAIQYGVQVYGAEPLMQYVVPLANRIDPGFIPPDDMYPEGMYGLPSMCPDVFAFRYLEGKIDVSFVERYEESEELLATLEGYGIDKDAFWYLLCFVKDYVDGQIYGAPLANTAGQNLKEIIDCLLLPGAKIEIKVPGHRYEYDGRLEMRTIAFAIDQLMPYIEKESNLANLVNEFRNEEGGNCIKVVGINSYDICGYVKEDKYRKNMIYRQYLFHKYMSMFLEGYQKSTKQVVRINGKQVGISYDKMLLISRALYIVGYTKNDDRSYYEEWNDDGEKKNDKLKNALRRYKEVTIRTDNAYYNH